MTGPETNGGLEIEGVLETVLYCDDLEAAELFYSDVLGLVRHGERTERFVFFRCGQAMLLLFDAERSRRLELEVGGGSIPPHGANGAGHVAFRVEIDVLDDWRARLATSGVEIESEVEWPGGGRSVYFRDPSGNSLELATPELWGLASLYGGRASQDPGPDEAEPKLVKVNLSDKLAQFSELWSPRLVGELNGQHVRLAKLRGEFVWHHHEHEDELFLVIEGRLTIRFRDREVELRPGEFLIVPRGVEHQPVCAEEAHVLLFEPATTINTGNVRSERTRLEQERI